MVKNLSALDHLKPEVKTNHDLVEETEHVTLGVGRRSSCCQDMGRLKMVIVDCWGTVPTERCVAHFWRGPPEQKRAVKRVLTQNLTEDERQLELTALILLTS